MYIWLPACSPYCSHAYWLVRFTWGSMLLPTEAFWIPWGCPGLRFSNFAITCDPLGSWWQAAIQGSPKELIGSPMQAGTLIHPDLVESSVQ